MEYLNNKINKVSRDLLLSLINYNDRKARNSTRKELINSHKVNSSNKLNKVPMIATVKILRTTFKEPLNYHIIVEAEGSNTTPQITQSRIKSFNSNWNEDPKMEFLMEKIENGGFYLNFKIIRENKIFFNQVESVVSLNIDKGIIGNSMEKVFKVFKENIIKSNGIDGASSNNDSNNIIGTIEFEFKIEPISKFGLRYWDILPICDPDIKIPEFAMPSESFVHRDEFNEIIVGFVIVYWLLRGEKNTLEMLPPNIATRSSEDYSKSDQFFTSRRLNGCNRPYNNFINVKDKQVDWDYELTLDFKGYEKKQDVWLPDTTTCRFKLQPNNVEDGSTSSSGNELIIVSIAYRMNDNGGDDDQSELIVQPADGSNEWLDLKIKYMMLEFNYNITWAHVGVHFIVEMYNMAFYRNIVNNPISKLLYPHFDGVIFNNWLVVRPMVDGVVTKAAALTYEGQLQMLTNKFKRQTYKDNPTIGGCSDGGSNLQSENIKDNTYDSANIAIWNAITEYVDEFFIENQIEILKHWNEIQLVSDDLVSHCINPDKSANEIKDIQQLKQCSIYIIYQAIFQHAWIHFNAWNDEAKAVIFNRDGTTSLKDIEYNENLGNAIEAGVQYPSPYVRQWCILDVEFGGPKKLQLKIWEHAHKINPAISISSLIMSPNI